MNELSNRILTILDSKQISRTEFAKELNVTQAYVSKMINKGAIPSDRLIEDICEKFGVREEWLRFGTGEMFSELTKDQELAAFTAQLYKEDEHSFKRRLVSVLSNLSEDEWGLLASIAEKIAKEKD